MRRADRARDLDFSLALIDRCSHGVVAINTQDGAPYCLPLSLVRVGRSLYFHSALVGQKLDLLRADPRVSVTFVGGDAPAFVPPDEYTTYFQSVIVTGTAHEVTDREEKIRALHALCQRMVPEAMTSEEPFCEAIRRSLDITAVWRIDLTDISGKEKVRRKTT